LTQNRDKSINNFAVATQMKEQVFYY